MQNDSMKKFEVMLQSSVSNSFRCQRAADSLDIDTKKKSIHHLKIEADIESDFCIGLIVGASGSGKTTLAKNIYGDNCFKSSMIQDLPIIDQLPKELSYDECAEILSGVGLTSVPCWIRPVYTLSNGQKARAEAALAIASSDSQIVIDEWTSVVDRTVAKVMSHCIQKSARKNGRKVILLSCHYDVIEWLDPDWIIDCNKQSFIDRRSLQPDDRKRRDRLKFEIKEVDRSTWKYFSKYHYLSDRLPGGYIITYGIFHNSDQIGFQCFANYVPRRGKEPMILHSNRTVIHPDYAGLGIGIKLINETSLLVYKKGYRVMAKFSSVPIYKAMIKQKEWKLKDIKTQIGSMQGGKNMQRQQGFRENVKTFSFEFLPEI